METNSIQCAQNDERGERRMTRLVRADRKAMVTQIATLYSRGEQKSILTCQTLSISVIEIFNIQNDAFGFIREIREVHFGNVVVL